MIDYLKCDESLPGISIFNELDKQSSSILLSTETVESLLSGNLKIQILKHGAQSDIKCFSASIGLISGVLKIFVGCNNAEVKFFKNTQGRYDLRLWRDSFVSIGKGTTSNGAMIVCANSSFVCGQDCMFSDGIIVQTSDQHGIVDLAAGAIVNNFHKKTSLGEHVWVGRQSRLLGNVSVGDGAIIGFGSVVASDIESCAIAVGVPARVIRRNVTWSRSPISLDKISAEYIKNFSA